jgi:hypothetical protein
VTKQEACKIAHDTAISSTEQRLKRSGLTRSYYLQKLKGLCECTKPISATVIHKAGKSKGAQDADSTTTDFIDVPDNAVQLNAIKTVIALYGDAAPEKRDVNIHGEISTLLKEIDGATIGPPAQRKC